MIGAILLGILCALVLIAIAVLGDDFIDMLARWYYGDPEQ